MKFECDKSLLSAAIDGVSRAITNRAAIPVLEGIYLKAEGFQLTLTGYDMEMGITTNIECNVQVPGETVLEAKLFGSMVSRMPSGTVSVELNNEGMAIISGGVAEFEIPAMNASDYPSLPNTAAENTMTIPTSMMRELIEKTIYAVAVEDKKPAHTGELFVIEPGRLTVVALDGYRLAIIKRDVECTRDIRIIIPAKTLQELLKITGGPDEPVKIDANRRYVVFTTNGYTIMSRLIEGEFLNYESVIPKESRTKVVIDCKSFIDTLERPCGWPTWTSARHPLSQPPCSGGCNTTFSGMRRLRKPTTTRLRGGSAAATAGRYGRNGCSIRQASSPPCRPSSRP